MWTMERILARMAQTPRLCALLLRRDTDGAWLVQTLSENGSAVPCRKAQDEKTAIRRMAQICRRTIDAGARVTVAYTDDLPTAAFLAGLVGRNTSFEPMEPAQWALALLYSGSLRSSPLV